MRILKMIVIVLLLTSCGVKKGVKTKYKVRGIVVTVYGGKKSKTLILNNRVKIHNVKRDVKVNDTIYYMIEYDNGLGQYNYIKNLDK